MFKPMLACSESAHNYFDSLRFPLLASPKIDGIRATVRDGVVYARSNQPFPNINVQRKFSHLEHFDGEFVLGSPTRHDLCRATGGVTNSKEKPVDDLVLYAFDHIGPAIDPFDARYRRLTEQCCFHGGKHVVRVEQQVVETLDQLLAYEKARLDEGYEGLILRNPYAPYKCGRSTAKEQYLLKLKRFEDAEAVVIGFEERMHNGNEATVSALGRTKRSSAKANKSGRGDLGALVCRTEAGIEFNIGTGFSDGERAHVWNNRDQFLGRFAKYKFFAVGQKEAPRHPVFLSWRDKIDMSR